MTARARREHSPGLLLAFLCVGIFIVYLDATIVNVALPTIARRLQAGVTELQWVVDAYTLTFACLLLTAGTLGDVLGRKRVFLAGLAGFTAASGLCALAPSIEVLLAARALQGVCGSVMIPVSLALVVGAYPDPRAQARAIGMWAGVGGLALAAGPVVGGVLVERYGWQSIFWLNLPVGLVAGAALVRLLRGTAAVPGRRLDPVGQVLFIAAIAALTYALIEGNVRGWDSLAIAGCFAGALGALVLFVLWELRHPDPLLPLRMFRDRLFTLACTVNFVALFGLFGSIFLLTLYLQSVNGLSAIETGVRFLALTVAIMVASFAASVVASRAGPRMPVAAGALLTGVGLLALTRLEVGTGFGAYWWSLAILGTGVSFVGAPATVAVLASVPPERAGTASGVSNTFRQVGAVFGVALSGAVVLAHQRARVPAALADVPLPDDLRAQVTAALAAGDLSQLGGLPEGLRTLVLAKAGPVFIEGMSVALAVAAAAGFVTVLAALLFMRSPATATIPASRHTRSAGPRHARPRSVSRPPQTSSTRRHRRISAPVSAPRSTT